MNSISDIDKNFKIETGIKKDGIKFYSVLRLPFKVYGIFYENGSFRRIPTQVAEKVNDGVLRLHASTAGGRVKFKTDSPYIAISAKMSNLGKMPHFAFTGSVGFDLYKRESGVDMYIKTFVPPFEITDGYESLIELGGRDMRELTVNCPLYSGVDELYIGLDGTAVIEEASDYDNELPMIFYGSSITQGGCASRPGNSYEAMLGRRFNCDYVNLGFSGSARAEDVIAEYISELPMCLFVYDYDHNSPSTAHYAQTHYRMFKKIREKQPDLPIIIMTRPKLELDEEEEERLKIARATYNNAIACGDNRVYFISGPELMQYAGGDGTVDGCHPNDLGFASMARALGHLMEEKLGF